MTTTRTINIFLASSNELQNDRNSFQAFIASLDDIYENRGWRIKCRRWEDFPAYCTGERTQDAYNKIVRAGDMCIAMFHKQGGRYTIEEFYQALDGYRQNGHPKTYVYARVLIDGEIESEELKAFKQELNDVMGHYWCNYATDDAMKLHFVMQFERLMNPEGGITSNQETALKVNNGVVHLHGREIARYENLTFASENEEYKRLKSEIEELEKDIVALRSLQNEALLPMTNKKLTKQNQSKELLKKLEEGLLDTALFISKILGNDTPISPRKRMAIDFFEMGNNKGVLETLCMEDIAADAEVVGKRLEKLETIKGQIDDSIKNERNKIRSLIEEYTLRSKALMQDYDNPHRLKEACHTYETAIDLAEKYLENIDIAEQYFGYAYFLAENNQFDASIKYHSKVLTICENLVIQHPEAYLPNLAMTQNNLALLYSDTNQLQEAEVLYKKALTIRKNLAMQNPEAYLPDLATTQFNLANLYSYTNRLQEAEELYRKALTISESLAEQYPEAYLPDVATTQNNLAALYYNTNRLQEAEELYKKALTIRERLAEQYPEAYLPNVAMTQNNLAILYYQMGYQEEALTMIQEALEKYTFLNQKFEGYFADRIKMTEELIKIIQSGNSDSTRSDMRNPIKKLMARIRQLFIRKKRE